MTRRRDLVVPVLAGAGYLTLGLVWLRFVYLSDFFQMIWLADAQRAGIGTAWANGFLGLGYPALLNLVTTATGDILTSGKLIQVASGVALLLLLPWASLRLFGDRDGVLAAQALLAVEPIFVFAAAGETPDLLATALMFPGLVLAIDAAERDSTRRSALAGVLLGLGYLVRYHSLLLALAVVATLLIAGKSRRTALWLGGGFLIAASPQLIASGVVQGSPFFNLHIKSIALGYYGTTSDFVAHTRPWTLWTIVTTAPLAVFKQYLVHVDRHFTAIGGSVFVLAALMLARRSKGRPVALLAVPTALLVLGLALKFYTDRAILLPLIVWYLVVGRAIAQAMAVGGSWMQSGVAVMLALAISVSSVLEVGRRESRIRRLKQVNDAVTRTLREHGVADSREVFATHLSYYLADDPRGGPFHPHDTWLLYDEHYARSFPHSYFSDVESLTAFVQREGIRFLLLGPLTGELAPSVLEAQRSGSLGPDYRLLGRWPDLYLFEYVPSASRPDRVQGVR
jgi:hypothetical protein